MARNFETFSRNLRRGVGESFAKKAMQTYGEYAIELIVNRTRQGFGVDRTGGNARRLKRLSKAYINIRRKNSDKLDRTTSPRKSNLTFTGQLLRSMRVKRVTNRKVIWGPNKRRRKGGLTNERLGEIVSDQGRPFNFLDRKQIKVMSKFVDRYLQKKLDRI